jgi:AraC family transcriptional regulator, regulatory protein of adaptative response / DNA-3-methyladenine glycosylase II
MLPKPFSWNPDFARGGRYDGKFIVGVLTTGIYCLPSCRAKPPKPENVRMFKTEEEALAAGLRACKRCRPDLFYRGEDEGVALFEGLTARVRADPDKFSDAGALAATCGVSLTKLGEVMRDHAQLAPVAWLRRERVRAACHLLHAGEDRIADIGFGVGFESESVFHRQFFATTRVTPGAYRALQTTTVFLLHLPSAWREQEILAYHARDAESACERVDGRRIFKALATGDGPVILEVSLENEGAWCRGHSARRLGQDTMAKLHGAALRMLGLATDTAGFEARASRNENFASLAARRKGLRLPVTPTAFDGLCWAIIGQQVNVAFAAALRREAINLAGEPVEAMRAHPAAERVADLDIADLTRRRFSRSKAEYLVHAAREVASGRLPVEYLGEGSAIAGEKRLTNIRGIGTWTARYALMRGAAFADCAPVGDSALATALQRLHRTEERPEAAAVHEMMRVYSPHRSLATAHLWASLKDAA